MTFCLRIWKDPDEMGHQGSVEKKVKAIERLDERIIRADRRGLAEAGGFPVVVLRIIRHHSLRTHTADNVPYRLVTARQSAVRAWHYNEREAAQTANFIPEGHKLRSNICCRCQEKSIFLFRGKVDFFVS